MTTYYHGTTALFDHFDISHLFEGDGKCKFGVGIYATSVYRTAVVYAKKGNFIVELQDRKTDTDSSRPNGWGCENQRRTIRRSQHYGKTSDGTTRHRKTGLSFV